MITNSALLSKQLDRWNLWQFIFLLLCGVLSSGFQIEQEIGAKRLVKNKADTSLAHQYLIQVDALIDQSQLEEAIELTLKAGEVFRSAEAWGALVTSYNLLARCYDYQLEVEKSFSILVTAEQLGRQYWPLTEEALANTYQQKAELYIQQDQQDSALINLDRANTLFIQQEDWEGSAWAEILMAISYYYQFDFGKMDSLLTVVYRLDEKHAFPPESEIRETVFQWRQLLYEETGAYEKAFALAQQALAERLLRLNSNFDSLMLATDYHNLGALYQGKGDYDEAIRYFKLALIVQSQIVVEAKERYEELLHIGLCLDEKKEHRQALSYFYKSLEELSSYPIRGNEEDYTLNYMAMGRAHTHNHQPDSAIYFLQLALEIAPEEYQATDVLWLNLGLAYQAKKEWPRALNYFSKALAINQQRHGNYHPTQLKLYQYLGEVYLSQGEIAKALDVFQKALTLLDKDFTSADYFENPLRDKVVDQLSFLNLLSLKIKALLNDDSTKSKLKNIYPTIRLAVALIDDIRQEYVSDGGRQLLSERGYKVYEMAIEVALQLHQRTGVKSFLDEAFLYSEKSKGLLLLASIQNLTFSKTYQQPRFDSLEQKLKVLELDIRFYEQKLFTESQTAISASPKKKKWEKLLNERRVEYEQCRYQLKKEFPDYYSLKFNYSLATLEDLQEYLQTVSATSLLAYFWGERKLYTFVVTETAVRTFQCSRSSELDQAIRNFLNLQKTNPSYTTLSKSKQNHLAAYTKTAYALYQQLIAPGQIAKEKNKLIIIPDGILNTISFEALLTEAVPSAGLDYRENSLPYLIKKYQVSYAYSSSLLLESLQRKNNKTLQNYGGFAPVFPEGQGQSVDRICTDQLEPTLAYSAQSVEWGQDLFGGQAFLHQAASKQNFLARATDFRLLHLSTHACVDEYDPMYSKIHFIQDDLHLYELYPLALNAELVVLSACETGVGKLVRGEGVYSWARGFMQAGCPAVITSLWNANDFSTSQIIMNFHENLQKGQAKDEALRNAKLRYLDEVPSRYSAPYFWATFVSIGNTTPLTMNKSHYFFLLTLALPLLLLVILMLFKKGDK